jgi:hypothetical protein
LNLGIINLGAANVLAGAGQFPVGLPPQPHEQRDLIMIAALVITLMWDLFFSTPALARKGEQKLE